MKHFLSSAAVFALIASPAAAQELIYGSFDYDFSRFSTDSTDADSSLVQGDVEFGYDQFYFGLDVSSQNVDFGGGDGTIRNYRLSGGFMPTAETLIGADITGVDIEGSNELNGYGVFGQYRTGQYGVALNYNVPESDDDDFTVTSLFGEFAATPTITISAAIDSFSEVDENFYIIGANYEDGPIFARIYHNGVTDIDASLVGVRGHYDFTNAVRVSAAFETASDFFFGDTNSYSIGAGYEFTDGFRVDGAIGRVEEGGEEADLVSFALSYDIGTPKRLDLEMQDMFRDDRRSGIGAIVPDVGIGSGFFFGL